MKTRSVLPLLVLVLWAVGPAASQAQTTANGGPRRTESQYTDPAISTPKLAVGTEDLSSSYPILVYAPLAALAMSSTTATNATYGVYTTSGAPHSVYVGMDNSTGTSLLSTGGLAYGGVVTTGNAPLSLGTSYLPRVTILPTSGNVGIGTTAPGSLVDIAASSASEVMLRLRNSGAVGVKQRLVSPDGQENRYQATHGSSYTAEIAARNVVGDADANSLQLRVIGTNSANTEEGLAAATRMTILGSGNVGIGTPAPAVKLDVGGWLGKPADVVNAVASVGGDLFSGNVGGARLRTTSNAAQGIIEWNLYYNGSGLKLMDETKPGYELEMLGTGDGAMNFKRWTMSGGYAIPSTLLTIAGSGGNVGIGTTTPTARLDVNGDIKANGVIHAKFQDIAEWVPSTEDIAPGTVVVVAARNHVAAATRAYDTSVAGVVSPQPGIALGEGGKSKVLVATTGRVKVRVDAANGPIREGDILVTSAIKGVAMKSQPVEIAGVSFHRPGTIIGKALESLEKGSGEILVLLSLQ